MLNGRYSIKDLEKITGIKAHTIRIWEQRYGILAPNRTDTNIRYYDDDDLQYILNISVLNKNGVKISKIADLGREQVLQEVGKVTLQSDDLDNQISSLVMAMLTLNEGAFNKVINSANRKKGFENTIKEVIYPFLEHIGNLWLTGAIRPAHEHFISNLIRQKIIAAVDNLDTYPAISSQAFLLFTPENEIHEISLLFSQYILRSRGFRTYYLGLNTPFIDLSAVINETNPDFLLTVVTSNPSGDALKKYIDKLKAHFPDKEIVISGLQARLLKTKLPEQVSIYADIELFTRFLDSLVNFSKN